MIDTSSLADIVLLAVIAIFIALRLRSVLGSRPEQEEESAGTWARPHNVVALPMGNRNGIGAILASDPAFDPNAFLQGAKTAFAMIVNAFSEGDMGTLRPLVADDIYALFAQALADQSLEQVKVVDVVKADILEAALVGSSAEITVEFTSDQELRGQISRIKDIWTFRRHVRSADPTWILVATRAASAP